MSADAGTPRVCRRCLLWEMDVAAFSNIYAYIESIDPAVRADAALYEERLSQCRRCESLVNGMCSLCGCFVEVRAAKRAARCAGTPRRW